MEDGNTEGDSQPHLAGSVWYEFQIHLLISQRRGQDRAQPTETAAGQRETADRMEGCMTAWALQDWLLQGYRLLLDTFLKM